MPIFIDVFHGFYPTTIVPTFIDIVPFLINIVPTNNLFLLSKLIGARLPNFAQTPTFGLKIACLFARLGKRLLSTHSKNW